MKVVMIQARGSYALGEVADLSDCLAESIVELGWAFPVTSITELPLKLVNKKAVTPLAGCKVTKLRPYNDRAEMKAAMRELIRSIDALSGHAELLKIFEWKLDDGRKVDSHILINELGGKLAKIYKDVI